MIQSFYLLVKERTVLLFIYFKVKITDLLEYLLVIFKYYSNYSFFKIDTALLFSYLFANPYGISRRFLQRRGEKDIYTYGETPLTTFDLISRTCHITARDRVVELGCGRGRTCFWLNQFIGCTVIGIDYVPEFIEKAQRVIEQFQVKNVSFRQEDLFQANLKDATVIYLYGTCFSASAIDLLIEQFSQLREGTKIITISYALTEFQPESPFQVLKQFPVFFTWGKTTVTLQIKTKRHEK